MPSEATATELLDAWANGDTAAAGVLFERNFDRLYRFFEISTPGYAEDLVQETLLAAVESRARFDRVAFTPYLMGIARNKALMFWRARGRRGKHVDVEALSLEVLQASPSTLLASHHEERRLLSALRAIPLSAQILLQMHYWDELTGPQLAVAIDAPEGTVRTRLRRAKGLVREAMQRLGSQRPLSEEAAASFDVWVCGLRDRLHAPPE